MKSGRLAVNVLIDLHNLGLEPKAKFDFLNKTIHPEQSLSDESNQLLEDYLKWLPEHFEKHNCNLNGLEKLEITFWTDFNKTVPNDNNQNFRLYKQHALTIWKAEGRSEEVVEIEQSEPIRKEILDSGKIPRITEV